MDRARTHHARPTPSTFYVAVTVAPLKRVPTRPPLLAGISKDPEDLDPPHELRAVVTTTTTVRGTAPTIHGMRSPSTPPPAPQWVGSGTDV